ncbi:MAG: D-alanine--D-alanine ligase [Proteobacteria bacterium]|nr:D-alanine--D-alanine ligase [SAR86 cluster bacterium]MDA0345547.1 D-alanine--D-alanine ligase [Pseudomonadota bacterium]MDA1056897.1 D-alanine--D-alanine ligase [Pseudomonadota bacterium]
MRKIIIVYGGESYESDISKQTAQSIFENIDRSKFDPQLINYSNIDFDDYDQDCFFFIAIHGKGGEDGEIQEILESRNFAFSGSSSKATKKCWNKGISKKIMQENQIPTPEFIVCSKEIDLQNPLISSETKFFIKPATNGSSFGVTKIEDKANINNAIAKALTYSEDVIIEKAFSGPEYTVSILGSDILPPLEIIPRGNAFYDFSAKYSSNETQKIIVTNSKIKEELSKIAYKTFHAHGCSSWARIDIVSENNNLSVLEINTVPGFTEKSLFPISANLAGISYKELITRIIEN